MPPNPLIPVSAVHHLGPERVIVTFNRPLADGVKVFDVGNWIVKFAGFRWSVIGLVVIGGEMVILKLATVVAVPPVGVTYDPPPFDVTDLAGMPAAAFADFPIT